MKKFNMKTWIEWIIIFIALFIVVSVGVYVKNVDLRRVEEFKDKQPNDKITITCHSKTQIINQERRRCQLIVNSLRGLCHCDCSEEIEDVEEMYRDYVSNLERNCYYFYDYYMTIIPEGI